MRRGARADRYLTTVLFTDVVDSTRLATELGDRQWRERIEQHNELIRRELRRFGGREIDTAGDGFFAAFDAPARAVACALTISGLMPELGLHIRAGLHTGEVEEGGGKLRGIGVHIGARVGASAGADEVLTSSTVRDLASGSGIDFEDRGLRELKGVDGEWHIYAARRGPTFATSFAIAAQSAGREVAAVRRTLEQRARRRRIGVIGGVAAVAVLAAAGLFLITRPPPSLAAVKPNSAGLIDAASGRIVAEVGIGARPDAITYGEGAIWVANTGDDTVSRIDPRSRLVVQTIDVGTAPSGVAVGYGSIWVTNSGDRTVSRINTATNQVVQAIGVGNGPTAVAAGAGAVWVTNSVDGTLSRIDPTTGTVSGVFPVGASPAGIAATDSAIWMTDAAAGTVIHIDPASGRVVASVGVGNGPGAVIVTNSAVWVANAVDGTVSRIDPTSNRATALVEVGQQPTGLAASSAGVWVASATDGGIYRIDPATNMATRIAIGSSPQALVVVNDELWFSARASAASHRGGTLRVVASDPFPTIDPALAFDPNTWSVLAMTNDGLVAFQRTGGTAGAGLVPDLAVSLPLPTDDGTTYTFQLRRGVVYSDGQPVRAQDFRHALERVYMVAPAPGGEGGAPFYDGIVGVSECQKHFGTCDLSHGIVTDDSAGTVTFHLRAPDPDFLRKMALPFAMAVPPSVGKQEVGNPPAPATGPYVIASFSPSEVRLVRNPRFHVWSHLAKPDGYPNEIVWTTGLSVEKQLDQIVSGKADAMFGVPWDRPDPARMAQLRAQYPAQVHPWVSGTLLFEMNTAVPPFNDVNVRRAVNLAIDRAKLVDLAGGPLLAEVTCQILLPNTQGYRPYCPYTANPNPGGSWTGPDGVKARQLVAASGKAGTTVRIATFGQFDATAKYLKSVLTDLGFKATVLSVDDVNVQDLYDPVKGRNTQALVVAWFPDFPAASSTVVPMFGCTSDLNFGRFCDRAIAAQTNRALDLQQSDAAAAGVAWAKVDQMLVDAAPVAALDNEREIDFVSARVGNYQSHPQWKILFDQLWVH